MLQPPRFSLSLGSDWWLWGPLSSGILCSLLYKGQRMQREWLAGGIGWGLGRVTFS